VNAPAALAAHTGAGVLAGPSQNSTTTGGRLADAALDYAARGWPVERPKGPPGKREMLRVVRPLQP